jgi:N-ethylmaleimide reductase
MPGLFDNYALSNHLFLRNRMVMAPLTRARSSAGDVPDALVATYYSQRASAGLIISEATDVSARSKGYAWTPGIYTDAQIQGWQMIIDAVRRHEGCISQPIWHAGRMAHSATMPNQSPPWGVTAERASRSAIFAHDLHGRATFVQTSIPRQMEVHDVAILVREFEQAFRNARLAGFDGVEIHGANGYLFDQFMNSALNTCTDLYGGGTPQTRTRLILEVVDSAIASLGFAKVGVRISPFGKVNSMPEDPGTEQTLLDLCAELSRCRIAYLHIDYQFMPPGNVDKSAFSQKTLSAALVAQIRAAFDSTLMWSGGFTRHAAQAAVEAGWADLIAFGRPFIANPDSVERLRGDRPWAVADPSTCYTRNGSIGYTDFPEYAGVRAKRCSTQ